MTDASKLTFYIAEGIVLADHLAAAGLFVALPCGGRGTCRKCRVRVSGALAPPTTAEKAALASAELAAGHRLLCQARASGGEVVFHNLPQSAEIAILATADLGPPSSELSPPYAVAATAGQFGVAFDVGTTTLVGYLVDLHTSRIVAVKAQANPQAAHGADVMSRIAFASTPAGQEILHNQIITALTDIATVLTKDYGVKNDQIKAITAVGNTCMHHLLLNLSPVTLGQSPYRPLVTKPYTCSAGEIGITAFRSAELWVGPVIGGFVGADAVAAAMACRLPQAPKTRLLIDLGTNGEILLAGNDRILACSAAAGPAFEGVQISSGMRAEPGAITRVTIGDEVMLQTIANAEPRGICGTGLVDVVAELLRTGLVDESGRLQEAAAPGSASAGVARRLVSTDRGPAFRLYQGPDVTVDITQKDIRDIQLAKGAIKAAVEILCLELSLSPGDITEVLLAGAFGNFIDAKNALRMGLLPPTPLAAIRAVGNAAGAGAVQALLSQEFRAGCTTLAVQAEHIELNEHPDFQERFVDALYFA